MKRPSKKQVETWLLNRDHAGVLSWARNNRGAYRILNGFTFNLDPLLRWRAIEILGRFAAQKAEQDLAAVRDIITRLLWSMNDESGATGWHAPEAIGEILANVPELISEYASHLPHFFKEEPFERGTYWAVARAAAIDPQAFSGCADELASALDSEDPYIRAFAMTALRALGRWDSVENERVATIKSDDASLEIYDSDSGELKRTTVGELAL